MPEETQWVTLHNPTQDAWHRVPNNPVVIQDFQDRGWETPEDSAARAEADAGTLHGQELEDALKEAGLSTSGTVKKKQDRLAEHRAEQAAAAEQAADPDSVATTQADITDNNENEGV